MDLLCSSFEHLMRNIDARSSRVEHSDMLRVGSILTRSYGHVGTVQSKALKYSRPGLEQWAVRARWAPTDQIVNRSTCKQLVRHAHYLENPVTLRKITLADSGVSPIAPSVRTPRFRSVSPYRGNRNENKGWFSFCCAIILSMTGNLRYCRHDRLTGRRPRPSVPANEPFWNSFFVAELISAETG
jgi:hypothetical protein